MSRFSQIGATALAAMLAPALAAARANAADAGLPQAARGQPSQYYAALARVNVTYRQYGLAETLQQQAIEAAKTDREKERLSFDLFDIYCRAKWWNKAAEEIERTLGYTDEGSVAQRRRYRLDRARVLAEANRHEDYVRELEHVFRLSKTDLDREHALRLLHTALKKLEKLEPKIAEYEAAVEKNPKDAVTLELLATIYYGTGLLSLPGKAIGAYEQLLELTPNDVGRTEKLARLYAETEEYDKSVALYERLMKLNPRRFRNYLFAGIAVRLKEGDKDAAIAWAKKIARDRPNEPSIPTEIGNILAGQRKYAEAATWYRKAIPLTESRTEKVALYKRLIETYELAQDYAAAETACREALRLDIRTQALRDKFREMLNRNLARQGKPREE
jgi:tetratricopeptide (TPR) repeat protein